MTVLRALGPLALALPLLTSGCRGKEVGRIELGSDLVGKGPLPPTMKAVWLDYDAKWVGGSRLPKATVKVEVMDGDEIVTNVVCDTQSSSTKVCGGSSKIGSTVDEDCEIDLKCPLTAPAGKEELELRATVAFDEPQRMKKIARIDVVLRE